MKKARGFTLLELMIVLVVIAILAGLALSGYQKQIRKSRRAEGKQILSDISLREEKYRANNAQYADCDTLLAPTTCAQYNTTANGPNKYYDLSIATLAGGNCPGTAQALGYANSYVLTAAPRAGTDQTKDTACGSLVMTNTCGTITKTPATPGCW